MYIAYLRGYEGKTKGVYSLGLTLKKYKEGKRDRINNLPNRYLKKKNTMKITVDWFISQENLFRNKNSFGRTYHVNGLKTKIEFIIDVVGYAEVYISQGNNFNNKILLGCVRTIDEVKEIYKSLTRGDEL